MSRFCQAMKSRMCCPISVQDKNIWSCWNCHTQNWDEKSGVINKYTKSCFNTRFVLAAPSFKCKEWQKYCCYVNNEKRNAWVRSNTDYIFTVKRGWECLIVDFGKLQKSLDTFPQIQTWKKMWGIPKLFNLPTNNSHEAYWRLHKQN